MITLQDYFPHQATTIECRTGSVLFNVGDEVHHVHQILSGKIKMVRNLLDGSQPIIHHLNAGEIVAESSMFSPSYHCQAITLVDTSLVRITKDQMLEQLQNNPDFSFAYIKMLSGQVRSLRMINEIKSIRSARHRIYRFLLIHADERNIITPDMSLKDIASYIGLTHETLYREIKALELEGKIERKNGQIQIILQYDSDHIPHC